MAFHLAMKLGAAVIALLTLAACSSTSQGVSSAPRMGTGALPSTPQPFNAQLTCAHQPVPGHALALFRAVNDPQTPLGVLDVSNATAPVLDCTLSQAQGGRFLSATRIAFWAHESLGVADLATGTVNQTARVAAQVAAGGFSADGTAFAYRVVDGAGGVAGHLFLDGVDRTLYTQEPIGGHGGPGPDYGPFDQIIFSPDGTKALDYMLFRPPSGPANLLVYRRDGSLAFQQGNSVGVWARSGSTLFFSVRSSTSTVISELDQLDSAGARRTVTSRLNGYSWPTLSPDGSSIVYNAPDNSVPDCGGLPHLWSLNLETGSITQLSKAVSSTPAFVGPSIIWSNEEQLARCGPGGPSIQDGVILAHDLKTGADSRVDLSFYLALTGSPAPQYITAAWVLDTRS